MSGKRLTRIRISAILWAIAWLFFFQVPFYVPDFPILYTTSKIVITVAAIPFFFVLVGAFATRRKVIAQSLFVVGTLLWLVVQSASAAASWFGQDWIVGVIGQVKLFAGLYFFAVLALLKTMRPTVRHVQNTVLMASVVLLIVLYWLWMPGRELLDALLESGRSQLVRYDEVRGLRLTLQAVLLQVMIFYGWRRVLKEGWRRAHWLVPVAGALFYLAWVSGQRIELAGTIMVMALASIDARRRRIMAYLGLAALGAAAAGAFGSLEWFRVEAMLPAAWLRMETAVQILSVLGSNPLRWAFGMGHLTRFQGTQTFQDLYGYNFWPSDVGWLGVIFEFGLCGAVLIGWWYVRLWKSTRVTRGEQEGATFIASLHDLVRKMVLTSVLIPSLPVYMGVGGTVLAIATWWRGKGALQASRK